MSDSYAYERRRHHSCYWCCALATFRKKFGLTQSQLGAIVGLSKNSISLIELAHSIPSVQMAMRISKVLRVPIEYLFWEESI